MNQQQFEQMFRQMQGGVQDEIILKREPTVEEIDLFIDRCVKEKGYTEHTLYQSVLFKLERGVHSPVEGGCVAKGVGEII